MSMKLTAHFYNPKSQHHTASISVNKYLKVKNIKKNMIFFFLFLLPVPSFSMIYFDGLQTKQLLFLFWPISLNSMAGVIFQKPSITMPFR